MVNNQVAIKLLTRKKREKRRKNDRNMLRLEKNRMKSLQVE